MTQLQARGSDCRPFWIVNAVSAQGDAAVVAMAASRDAVIGVVADFGAATALPKPERLQPMQMLGVEWGVAKIHAPEVWALGFTGQGVVVGGQDTGYTWDHPALKSAYRGWDGAQADHNYNWHDAIHAEVTNGSASAVPWDDDNHGTHTMGTMVGLDGANQVGVAPGARWIGCRNMAYGDGTYTRYLECFEWMLVLSAHPALKGQVDRIESLLERTAQPCGQSPDNTYGWGRVDALAAVGLGDSDGDSLPNWWEYVFGLNPAQAGDAADDPDKDGMSTWQEWICNTDPTLSICRKRRF